MREAIATKQQKGHTKMELLIHPHATLTPDCQNRVRLVAPYSSGSRLDSFSGKFAETFLFKFCNLSIKIRQKESIIFFCNIL